MLQSLHVKNIALIDDVEIEFGPGMNVLSGETGAGKSILIDSVNFALGARMPKDIVRENAEYALCELVFSVDDEYTRRSLMELDIDMTDDSVILQRKIVNGKSSLKINGESMTAQSVGRVAAVLIDIHGQHEHQSLLYKNNHRIILDKFCGDDFAGRLDEYKTTYREYRSVLAEYEEAVNSAATSEDDADYCSFVINEIDSASLNIGEDEKLEDQFKRMNNARRIVESMQAVREYLEDDEAGAAMNISKAIGCLKGVMSLDEGATELFDQLFDVENLLHDFERSLSDYEADLVFSPEEYALCEDRLNEINRLKQKYAPTIEGILERRDKEQKKLDKLLDYDSYIEDLHARVESLWNEVLAGCKALSDIRKENAHVMEKAIREALADLNFLNAQFEIAIVSDGEKCGETGFDDIEFLISTNPGERVKPLTQVASGGELSRIMLALKAVFAGRDSIGTLIFDEIDTGISGKTAQMVAAKMRVIATSHQVICVTHLPQIAAAAQNHFVIEKNVSDGRTITSVMKLDYEGSIGELARMLSGSIITDATLANAREMKEVLG